MLFAASANSAPMRRTFSLRQGGIEQEQGYRRYHVRNGRGIRMCPQNRARKPGGACEQSVREHRSFDGVALAEQEIQRDPGEQVHRVSEDGVAGDRTDQLREDEVGEDESEANRVVGQSVARDQILEVVDEPRVHPGVQGADLVDGRDPVRKKQHHRQEQQPGRFRGRPGGSRDQDAGSVSTAGVLQGLACGRTHTLLALLFIQRAMNLTCRHRPSDTERSHLSLPPCRHFSRPRSGT